jgi:hypothetical protein
MSEPKRQKVIDEARLSEVCDNSEKLFDLVVQYQRFYMTNEGYGPFHNEELKEARIFEFLHTSLNCPEEFAEQLSRIYINAMLNGKVYNGWGGPYSFNSYFWGVTDTWAHRNFPELNINGPVSEPLRKRLLVIHGKYKTLIFGTKSYDKPYWKPVTEMYTLYWLTRSDWRPNFFRTWIRSTFQIESFDFDPVPVIPLLKSTDNLGFYLWCLDRRCFYPYQLGEHKLSIWNELTQLVPDRKKMEDVFCIVTGWYNLNEHSPSVVTQERLRKCLCDSNKAFAENIIIPGFSSDVRSIQWQERINWLCIYVAIALDCDTPIWESLFYYMYYNRPDISV